MLREFYHGCPHLRRHRRIQARLRRRGTPPGEDLEFCQHRRRDTGPAVAARRNRRGTDRPRGHRGIRAQVGRRPGGRRSAGGDGEPEAGAQLCQRHRRTGQDRRDRCQGHRPLRRGGPAPYTPSERPRDPRAGRSPAAAQPAAGSAGRRAQPLEGVSQHGGAPRWPVPLH